MGNVSWFRKLFPKRSLAGVVEATQVRVWGRMKSGDDFTSPLTGSKAALFFWTVGVHAGTRSADGGGSHDWSTIEDVYAPVASRVWGGEPLVECKGGLVVVATEALSVSAVRHHAQYRSFDGPLPEQLSDFAEELEARGRLPGFVELALHQGDRVRLNAVVRATGARRRGGDGYRAAPDAPTHRAEPPAHIQDYSRVDLAKKYL